MRRKLYFFVLISTILFLYWTFFGRMVAEARGMSRLPVAAMRIHCLFWGSYSGWTLHIQCGYLTLVIQYLDTRGNDAATTLENDPSSPHVCYYQLITPVTGRCDEFTATAHLFCRSLFSTHLLESINRATVLLAGHVYP
jgi:hypothetical protein